MKNLIYPLATAVIAILLWYVAVLVFGVPSYLLPLPGAVFHEIVSEFPFLMWHTWITTYETIGGFALSIVLGIGLALAIVSSRAVDKALMPWLILSQTFPKVALAPLIIVWFGLGIAPKLIVTFLVAFFPVVISTVVGLRSVEGEMLELAHSMRATPMQLFWHFRLPFALPNLFAGLKVSVAFAVVGAVIAEWVSSNEGLGYLLIRANANLDTTLLFAVLVMLMIIGVLLYYAVALVEYFSIPWHQSMRLKDVQPTM
ncbi:MAG: ABC transporter permease [Candidimonas sp.]|nr:MAG: ABC transporter permease [Candidimonas sp.]